MPRRSPSSLRRSTSAPFEPDRPVAAAVVVVTPVGTQQHEQQRQLKPTDPGPTQSPLATVRAVRHPGNRAAARAAPQVINGQSLYPWRRLPNTSTTTPAPA